MIAKEKGQNGKPTGQRRYIEPEAEASSVKSWDIAYSALRVASWQSAFYLITDSLGPY